MADKTNIDWADSTFNPFIGCTKVSPACDHCYAERDTKRFGRVQWGAGQPRVRTSAGNWKKPLQWDKKRFMECGSCGWRGELEAELCGCPSCNSIGNLNDARRRVFCASLADVFDNEVDPAWRRDLFNLIVSTPALDWMILTKRIGNAARMIEETLPENMKALPQDHPLAWPWPNVWIGATICNQKEADRDIPKLLEVPAAVRFLSIEPMLGPVDLQPWLENGHPSDADIQHPTHGMHYLRYGTPQIDWVIVGGESGPEARPMHPDWARSLRDQCAAVGVPLLFKQWGEWAPEKDIADDGSPFADSFRRNAEIHLFDGGERVYRVGKKRAGRLLDGTLHHAFPEPK